MIFLPGSNRIPDLLLAVAMLCGGTLLTACDGGSGSSSQPPPPPPGKADVLVYQSATADGSPARLYRVNRSGESILLSGAAGESPVVSHAVSPDTERVAYVYQLGNGQSGLVIQSLDGSETEQPAPIVAGTVVWLQWLPDSRRLVYAWAVFREVGFTSSVYLANVGEPDPIQLIGEDLGENGGIDFALLADGGQAAVAIRYYDYTGDVVPEVPASAALYLVDLSGGAAPLLIDTAAGDANSFKLAASPYANQLLYQRRLLTPYTFPGNSTNHPVGPLTLMTARGESRPLRDIPDDEGWVPWVWLGSDLLLVAPPAWLGAFEVIATDGRVVASHATTGNGNVVPSPAYGMLAFLDKTDGVRPEVYILDLASGEYRIAGPASSIFATGNFFFNSELRWSADGSWLAWNRDLDYEQTKGELYAYNIDSAETRMVAPDLGSAGQLYPLPRVSWLPEGNVLDYLVRTGTGFAYTTADLATGKNVQAGDLNELTCTVKLAWPTNQASLWNRCGEGVYLSRIGKKGSVTQTRLLDREVYSWAFGLTANRQLAVMQPVAPTDDDPANNSDPNWQMYDVIEDKMVELKGTGGATCCGSFLQ